MIRLNNNVFNWFFIALFLLILAGCASKKYTRQAVKYEQAEMYGQAVDQYLLSLQKKSEKMMMPGLD